MSILEVLVVDDDPEYLHGLKDALPESIADYEVFWDYASSFDEAVKLLGRRRFDLVVADIYLGDAPKALVETGQVEVNKIVGALQNTRFCPMIAFSSGSRPDELVESPFVRFVQKGSDFDKLLETIEELIATGIPKIARTLHDEIDKASSTYLWEFLVNQWASLQPSFTAHDGLFERIVRRRASVALSRLDDKGVEIDNTEGGEYYLYPPITPFYRLGEILQSNATKNLYILLTPHCHLVIQPGKNEPKADYVLLAKIVAAQSVLERITWPAQDEKKAETLRKQLGIPSGAGVPKGRYWFIPGFLEIEDGYVDFMQIMSEPFGGLADGYKRIAVLDSPFAESLQSLFTIFYASLGTPVLETSRFDHLTVKQAGNAEIE